MTASHRGRTAWAVVLAALAAAGCGSNGATTTKGAASAQAKAAEKEHEVDVRTVAHEQKIQLGGAIERALEACPGEAMEAGLEGEERSGSRSVFVEVMVVAKDGRVHEVKVGAADGKVLSNEIESEADESSEILTLQSRLPANHAALLKIVHGALDQRLGRIVSASFDRIGGATVGVVEGVDGTELRRVLLDPSTAKPLGAYAVVRKDREDAEDVEDEAGEAEEEDEMDEHR
jgi:uncharacterized membrane protein YkoI